MASLAVFDFDRTLVLDDSDATIISRLREKQPPPEWEAGSHDWTPYMSDLQFRQVFEHAYSAGLRQEDILEAVGGLRATPGAPELLGALASRGWDVLVLTDANSVFVNHWLKVHHLERCVTAVVTNRAFWRNGRLYIEPCMRQTSCARCPSNLCKTQALRRWSAAREPYARLLYAGDGRNDYCPATSLPPSATVFPRKGYPMADLIAKTLASPAPQVCAKVVPWEDAYTILREIVPDAVLPT